MEREGVSHISIPYRMPPPTSPLSLGGWVAQKKALRYWPIFQPARGVIAQPRQHHQRHNSPLHLYPHCPQLEYTNCNYPRNVRDSPIAPINSQHFRENERNKNTILWRSLFPGLLATWVIPAKLNIDLRRACRACFPIGVADTVPDVLLQGEYTL